MAADYFGFSYVRAAEKEANIAINNAADISVIVIYFLVVLAVGIWVSIEPFKLPPFRLTKMYLGSTTMLTYNPVLQASPRTQCFLLIVYWCPLVSQKFNRHVEH